MPKRKIYPNPDERLGANCRDFRLSKNLTQKQVADFLSIDRTTYTKYENCVMEPSIFIIRKLAELFEVDFNSLFK